MNWQRWADIVHHKHRTIQLLQKDRLFRCASKHSRNDLCRPVAKATVDTIKKCFSWGKCLHNCNRAGNCLNSASIDIAFLGETDPQRLMSCLSWPVNVLSGIILRISNARDLQRLFDAFLLAEFSGRKHLSRTFGPALGTIPIRVYNSKPDRGRSRTNHIESEDRWRQR